MSSAPRLHQNFGKLGNKRAGLLRWWHPTARRRPPPSMTLEVSIPSRSFSCSLCFFTCATVEASDVRDSLRTEAYTTLVPTLRLAGRVHFLVSIASHVWV